MKVPFRAKVKYLVVPFRAKVVHFWAKVVSFWVKPSGPGKASRKRPGRVLPWPGRVIPGSTLPGCFRARAQAGNNHYQLVRPFVNLSFCNNYRMLINIALTNQNAYE